MVTPPFAVEVFSQSFAQTLSRGWSTLCLFLAISTTLMRWKCKRAEYCVWLKTFFLPRVRPLAVQHALFQKREALQTVSLSYRRFAAVA